MIKIAGGKPKPAVKWFKEEEEITTTVETYEVVEIEDTVTLIIKSAKPENAGNYYAQLLNEAGTISTNKAQLIVNSALFVFFFTFSKFIFVPLDFAIRQITKIICFTKGGPVFVKVPEPLAPINKDESVRFECIVEANPKPNVNW